MRVGAAPRHHCFLGDAWVLKRFASVNVYEYCEYNVNVHIHIHNVNTV